MSMAGAYYWLAEGPVRPSMGPPGAPLAPTTFDRSSAAITHWDLPANQQIPAAFDRRWWRANFACVEVPSLPFVVGGSSEHPERALTGLWYGWPDLWQGRVLEAHARRNLSHFVNWWSFARDVNHTTIPQFVAGLKRQQAMGFYTSVNWTSKDFDVRDGTVEQRRAGMEDCLDACLDAGVLDIDQPGWELDLYNNPDLLPDFIGWLADTCGSRVDHYAHFSSLKTAWQRNGHPRADFWTENASLTGLLYQADPTMSIGDQQAHLHDAQVPAAGLAGKVLVGFELKASVSFSGDAWTETRCDGYGWGALCTPGEIPVSGFGNGARHPDGRWI